ncbi:MAG: ATP-binding protein [Bacteroidales bacterium]|nr:ATP-binding protein [Bacteroidales bacterium]MDD2387309.1 ATP-binding protein [Bacteroidales bacterium]MDD4217970.1 ATP-binding protein [Bacteroidales bacterium]MDY0143243.1 ATP-binding protein [Bacteroidales bacterium]
MIQRDLTKIILELRLKFPVITLTGPRQSGKTTLLKSIYKNLPYISLEDIDNRNMAIRDPRGFLSNFPQGAILDEVQRTPDLFSYIQGIVDSKKDVHFVLSGSQNFQLLEKISQSLAGRTAVLKLLPFSLSEISNTNFKFESYEDLIFKGLYPAIYDKDISPEFFYPSYINTYIEKDVRSVKNIENLSAFSLFLQLCAGRTGQLLNLNSLAMDAGISPNTAKSWLSILESSYIIYLLHPYHKNFNKRIVKTPKLYFYDTGLVCSLLGIENAQQVKTYYAKGVLFENMVINEFYKSSIHAGKIPRYFFWQNKTKQEIDIIKDTPNGPIPFEIKSGMTIHESYFHNLKYWKKINDKSTDLSVIYGGDQNFSTSSGNIISWRKLQDFLK